MSLFARLPTAAWPLGAGLICTSTMFFGNIGLEAGGTLPMIREKLGVTGWNEKTKVRAFSLFFDGTAPVMATSSSLATILFLVGRYYSTNPQVRLFAAVGAGASIAAMPLTLLAIIPVVNQIKVLDKKAEADWTPKDKRESMEKVLKWNQLHMVRLSLFGVSWAAGLYALLLAIV